MTGFTMPAISIQCAFGYGPFDASPTWTEVNTWCQAFSTKRGRQHELQRFEAGTLELVLNNQDGRFSQWNTSSPYAGNLLPSTPIKITATWNGTTHPVFYGFVNSWIPQYGQIRAEQVIKATDAMQLLALGDLDESAYPGQIIADGAVAYYQLADQIGSTTAADSSGNGLTGTDFGDIAYGGDSPLLIGYSTSAAFDGASSIEIPANPVGSAITLEAWVQTTTPGGTIVESANITSLLSQMQTEGSGVVSFAGATGMTNICDGNWHHIVGVHTGSTTSIYVDSFLDAEVSASESITARAGSIGSDLGQAPWTGSLAQVAIYDTALTASQILDHYQLGSTGWLTPQFSGQRIAAVLDVFGWPIGMRDIATGISQVQAATGTLNQTAALSYIQTVEATEQGFFFVAEDGKLTFYDRHYILTAPAARVSQGYFASDNNPAHFHYLTDLVPAMDDLDLWNDVPGSRQNGVPQRSVDQDSIDRFGNRTLSGYTGMLQESDDEVQSLTQWLLAHYGTPISRIRQIAVDNTADSGANFPQMLGRKLLDCITVDWLPKDGSTVHFIQPSGIESIQHDVTQATWKTTWGLTPAETQPYLILDDAARGKLDSGNLLAY